MKYSTLLLALLLTGLIVAGIVFSGCTGKSNGSHSVSIPTPIKVYSSEKGGFITSETVIKTEEEWRKQLTPELYSPEEIDGSRNGSPDSDGFIIEAHYLPMDKIKFTMQYIIYNKFNGAHTNYDGSGRDASDNNTLYFALSLLL